MSKRKCNSLSSLNAELEAVRGKVSLEETEESWDKIEQGILQLTKCCNNGGCDFATEMVAGIRSLSRSLIHAMNSERSRLSGSAIELVTVLLANLGPSFEPLVSLFMPTLLGLCSRTNKVFTSRAKACIFAVIENTQLPSLLPYLAESVNHKSAFLRLVAAEGVLACLNCFNPPDIEKDTRARLIEDVIKSTARDASAEVRKAGKKIFEAYKALLPDRVESFIAPLTPVIKKYLDVQGMTTSRSRSQLVSNGPATTGRVTAKPLGSLQAQKTSTHSRAPSVQSAAAAGLSSKHAEKPSYPFSAELPRDVPSARLRAVPNPVISGASAGLSRGTVREPSRQGVLRPPSERGPSTTQKDIPRPVVSVNQGPQRVGGMLAKPHDEKLRVGGGARRVLIATAPLPETDDIAMTQTISKTASRTLTKREHPTASGTSSRIGKSRSHDIPPAEVGQAQTSRKQAVASNRSSQQAAGQRKPVWGGRSLPKASKPVVKALSIRSKLEGKNPDSGKPGPEHIPLPPSPTICPTTVPLPSSPGCSSDQSCQSEPLESAELAQVTTHDSHDSPKVGHYSTPLSHDIHIRESPAKTPITALLSSIQRGFLFTPSSPLSPPQTYVTEVTTHTYCPSSPTGHKDIAFVSLVQECAGRQALEVMDIN